MHIPYRPMGQQRSSLVALAALYIASWIMLFLGTWDALPRLDIPFHFFGGFFTARFFAAYVFKRKTPSGSIRQQWMIVALAFGVGMAWELYEYALTMWLGEYLAERDITRCCIGTAFDTGKDLVMDTLGAIIAVRISLRSFTKIHPAKIA